MRINLPFFCSLPCSILFLIGLIDIFQVSQNDLLKAETGQLVANRIIPNKKRRRNSPHMYMHMDTTHTHMYSLPRTSSLVKNEEGNEKSQKSDKGTHKNLCFTPVPLSTKIKRYTRSYIISPFPKTNPSHIFYMCANFETSYS